jgi:hypothetical protein
MVIKLNGRLRTVENCNKKRILKGAEVTPGALGR